VKAYKLFNIRDAKALGRIADRLEDLSATRGDFICGRCRNIREFEEDFPDRITKATRLRIGSGESVEYITTTPLMATILDKLVAGRGKIQSHETLIFHCYSTGVHRPGQSEEEPDDPIRVIRVLMCRFRKKLAKLSQDVRIETRHGQGMILLSDVPEIVLELW